MWKWIGRIGLGLICVAILVFGFSFGPMLGSLFLGLIMLSLWIMKETEII